jgi:hypothetical protein
MNAKPVLGDWEVPRMESIRAVERRSFVELAVPGRVGSLFQDMNTVPTRIVVSGGLYGDEAWEELEKLRAQFRAGEPVTFVADITTATEVQYVIIETLRIEENNNRPDQVDYFIALRESPPPPPPPNPLGALDTGLLEQAGDFLDTITGALDIIDTLGSLPDLADPTPPLTDALNGVTAATTGLSDTLAPLGDIFGTNV